MSMNTSISGRAIREIVLEQSFRAHVGHIGSALSIADILSVLYGHAVRGTGPTDPLRDRVVLSKGHAALGLYAALALRGWLDAALLTTYCGDDSLLGVHPETALPGVDFSTGSLGQGLTFAAGSALGAKMRGAPYRTFAVVSDAECNEGSIWEAAMFAAHRKLGNLIAIIDFNGQQAMGYTRDICEPRDMAQKWAAFGWDAHDADGHDEATLMRLLSSFEGDTSQPHVVIAHTTFGKGVSYMEKQIRWHYMPMSADEYSVAQAEVKATA